MAITHPVVLDTITRQQIRDIIESITLYSGNYSQSSYHPQTKRRADCSGAVSEAGALPTSGAGTYLKAFSTSTLVSQGKIREIPRADLQYGDLIGHCGPNTCSGCGSSISGHVAVYLGERNGDDYKIWDHGSGSGPKVRWVRWNAKSTGWLSVAKAWRFTHLVDGGGGLSGGTIMFANHGDKGPVVTYLQKRLLAVGATLPRWGADGGYGDETAAALASRVGGDGRTYGPDQMLALDVLFAGRYGPAAAPVDLGPINSRLGKVETGLAGVQGAINEIDPPTLLSNATAGAVAAITRKLAG